MKEFTKEESKILKCIAIIFMVVYICIIDMIIWMVL